MSTANSPGRIPGILFGTTNLERVLRIFALKAQGKSPAEIGKILGISRQACDYHLKRNAEFVDQYGGALEILDLHKDNENLPEDLREAIQKTLDFFPKLAAA